MMASFRDVCGQSYNISLPENATVADACKLLSEKTGINDNQIFLMSNAGDINFYQDAQSMSDILKENPDYVIFMKNLFGEKNKQNISQLESNKTDDITEKLYFNQIFEQSLIVPPNSFLNRLQSDGDWQYSDTYDDYTRVMNSIPYDFEERVYKIAEYGFAIHDIKEVLRNTDYDVLVASHLPVSVNSHRLDDMMMMMQVTVIMIVLMKKMKSNIIIVLTLVMRSPTKTKPKKRSKLPIMKKQTKQIFQINKTI